jgi:antitoxin ParD1/3/4
MTMATMNVSLPDTLKDWAEGRTQTGHYSNTSDYVRDLIRKDKERVEKIAAMQRLIDDAEASGATERSTAEILASARRAAGVKRGV